MEAQLVGQVIGQFIGNVIGGAIAALIGALLVQLATHWVCKFKPPYGMAYKAIFLAYIASWVVGFFVGFMVAAAGGEIDSATYLLIIIIGFFVTSGLYGIMIKHPESGPIGFSKACLVSLINLIMGAALFGGTAMVVSLVMSA